jgi:hypothetical protein
MKRRNRCPYLIKELQHLLAQESEDHSREAHLCQKSAKDNTTNKLLRINEVKNLKRITTATYTNFLPAEAFEVLPQQTMHA